MSAQILSDLPLKGLMGELGAFIDYLLLAATDGRVQV